LDVLSSTQLQAFTSNELNALTTSQFGTLSTSQISVLTTTQISNLSTTQIQNGITTSQIAGLSTNQLLSLTTTQFVSLSTSQLTVMSSTQMNAYTDADMTAVQTYATSDIAILSASPIVLDLKGTGLSTISMANGVNFDLLNNGQVEKTGWISEGEGLLMMRSDNNTSLTDGGQLFGQGTTLANGEKALNGYQALAELDTNHDGVINAEDTAFNKLGVWVDTGNSNGIATGQFETLDQLGITQLNLNAQASTQVNNGNLVGLVSSFQTASGATNTMADVWFMDKVIPGASSTVITSPTSPNLSSGVLGANVSGLANAISSFNQGISSPISTTIPLNTGPTSTAPTGVFSPNILSTLTALSQFNANGQLLGSNTTSANQVASALNTTGSVTATPTLAIPTTKKSS
jgi:hypothetical protein